MKNKNIISVLLIIIVVIFIVVFSRAKLNKIDENIYNKNWYHYNHNTGFYDVINFNKNKISLNKPINSNDATNYDYCRKYTYDRKNNILNLDCNKQIKIIDINDDMINLEMDDRNYVFFTNIEESLNYEFDSYYSKSMVEYKKEKSQAKDFIKINSKKLMEVINGEDYSKIVFIGNKCTSVDCVLGLDVMEKWISTTENVYYYDVNDLNRDLLNRLNRIDSSLETKYDFYNDIYPLVVIFNSGKLIEKYYINCDGFNCSKYYKNEFN